MSRVKIRRENRRTDSEIANRRNLFSENVSGKGCLLLVIIEMVFFCGKLLRVVCVCARCTVFAR